MRPLKVLVTGMALCITSMLTALTPVAASPGVAHATNISKTEKSFNTAFSLNLAKEVHLDITNLSAENGIKISNFIKAMDAEPALKLIIVKIDSGASRGGDFSATQRVSEAMMGLKVRYAQNSSFLVPTYPDCYAKHLSGWIDISTDLAELKRNLVQTWLPGRNL